MEECEYCEYCGAEEATCIITKVMQPSNPHYACRKCAEQKVIERYMIIPKEDYGDNRAALRPM